MTDEQYQAYGRHILVDISDAAFDVLNNEQRLKNALISAATAEGVTVVNTLVKTFEPSGVTILLLLAESHVSLHTYPVCGKAFFDAFTCGADYKPENIFRAFAENTLCGSYTITEIDRGVLND